MDSKRVQRQIIHFTAKHIQLAVVVSEQGRTVIAHSIAFGVQNIPDEETIAEIKNFLKKTKTASKIWIPLVSQSDVLWKQIRVPSADEEEIHKMTMLAMKTVLGGGEFVFDG